MLAVSGCFSPLTTIEWRQGNRRCRDLEHYRQYDATRDKLDVRVRLSVEEKRAKFETREN